MEPQHLPITPSSAASDDGPTSAPRAPRRACDCCRKRKVKCDGGNPCTPCQKANIPCAYLQPPKKKGPKGLRSQRVLKMLRHINGNESPSPTTPLSPRQPTTFGNWAWNTPSLSPDGSRYNAPGQQDADGPYGPQTSVAPDQTYYQPMPTSAPQQPHIMPQHQQYNSQPMQYATDAPPNAWSTQTESLSGASEILSNLSPAASERLPLRLPAECFLPYIQLFFKHMFPIMPVIESNKYLDPAFYSSQPMLNPDEYCFLCSICAATIVQLDESISQPPPLYSGKRMDAVFADECLRERRTYDHIEVGTRLSVMTSFFMFAYYGNHEKFAKAWLYLHESITLCENMNMENENAYSGWDAVEAQWRRRLYWLLFITERAYAVQRRKHTRLFANVRLPTVLDGEDPHLLNGFVNLAKLFSAVDEDFVKAWLGVRKQSLCDEEWLAKTQRQLDDSSLAFGNISETQRMDINVTREWLHMLAWQMGVSNGLMRWGQGGAKDGMNLDYPIELAKKVVQMTSSANALALDSHGIGMEQKLYDIGVCLADVLRIQAGDTSTTFLEGREALHSISQKLSSIRGKESRYLKPLVAKMEGLMGYELNTQTLLLPLETPATFGPLLGQPPTSNPFTNGNSSNGMLYFPPGTPSRLSMVESMNMLRSLSMSGSWSAAGLAEMMEGWGGQVQRRESGRVYDEGDVDAWLLGDVVSG